MSREEAIEKIGRYFKWVNDESPFHVPQEILNALHELRQPPTLADLLGIDLRQAKKVEPKKYYAKIKGWELAGYDDDAFWNYNMRDDKLFIGDKEEVRNIKTIFTKTVWAELGINDSNADFEEVE